MKVTNTRNIRAEVGDFILYTESDKPGAIYLKRLADPHSIVQLSSNPQEASDLVQAYQYVLNENRGFKEVLEVDLIPLGIKIR